jgi:predicted Fe-Mo cluster-binding NifX family protein
MKIVFTAKDTSWDSPIDPRFGRTRYLLVYNTENKNLEAIDNTEADEASHGVGPVTAKKLFDTGADVLITGNGPGNKAAMVLQKTNLKIFTGAENFTVEQALAEYEKGNLNLFE